MYRRMAVAAYLAGEDTNLATPLTSEARGPVIARGLEPPRGADAQTKACALHQSEMRLPPHA